MKAYLEVGVFRSLKDENTFKTAKVSFDTVEGTNKADIDPEILYAEAINVSALS